MHNLFFRIFCMIFVLTFFQSNALIKSLQDTSLSDSARDEACIPITTSNPSIHCYEPVDHPITMERLFLYNIQTEPPIRITHMPSRSTFRLKGQTMRNISLREMFPSVYEERPHIIPYVICWYDNADLIAAKLSSFFDAGVHVKLMEFSYK